MTDRIEQNGGSRNVRKLFKGEVYEILNLTIAANNNLLCKHGVVMEFLCLL